MDSGGKANRSVVQNLFGGHRVRRSSIKESKAVQGPKMDVLMAMVEAADWAGLEAAVYEHWSHTCPQVFMPNAEKPWEINIDEQLVESVLLGPLTALYMADESEKSMKNLAQKIGFKVDERRPGQICGYMFKSGEPTYTCKECANDPTCVLCYKCFVQSPHRQHKYRMHTSGGSGYCDCGDDEAWKRHPSCELHRPLNEDERMETGEHSSFEMPAVVEKRLRALTVILLRYATRVICWQTADELPDGLTRAAGTEVPYQTILFNDETHTYDAVIRALELAIHCTEQQAMLLATIVDREGRSSVRAGSKDICDKAKTEIQRKTAKDTNPRTEKKGPLEVKTMDSSLVAHQQFAIRVLTWLISSAQDFPPLAKIIGDVLLNEKSERHAEDVDGDTLIVTLMRFDRQLWKAARQNVHQMLMTTVLMDLDQKKEFSRKFLQLYTTMFNDFIDDDHDHNVSVVALTVQMFTVPTIARMLIAEESAMKNILGSLVDYCKQYEGAKGRYDFTRKGYPVVLKRALYMVHDLRYLLTSPPSKDEWTPLLRSRFLEGCQTLFTFLSRMQGMDDVRRQAGEHQVYESEWETAFNIQLRIQTIITLVLSWAATDAEVHRALLTTCFSLIKEEAAHYDFNKIDSVEVSGHETSCISFDVSRQRLSAHMPIWRLAAGLFASAPEGSTYSFVSSLVDSLEKVGCPGPAALMEMPLRVNVLCAQSQASMWRRNGFSLINQIHNYFSPLCRTEMYDKDILMLQVGAALTEPNDFVIRVLNRYGLDKWAEATYEETRSPSTDELSKLTVSLAEELLHLFIILVGERWTPGVGQTTREDLLRREVLHILCTGPKPFSKIEHHIPDDPLIEKLSLDEVVRAIGDFRKPAGTTAGTFQLKASFREEYNPFFYHYSKSDLSQAEQHQQKERKDLERSLSACPPPKCPKFSKFFESVRDLLKCDLLLKLISVILERTARRSRFSSDGLLHKTLYLIGMGLNEQMADADFHFVQEADKLELLSAMEKVNARTDLSCADLLWWTIKRYKEVSASVSGEAQTENAVESETSEAEKKAQKALIAAEKRKRAMEQMARMQRQFLKQNMNLISDDSKGDDLNDDNDDDEIAGTLPDDSGFPVAVGPYRSSIGALHIRKVTCILCQEVEEVSFTGRAVVCAAFIQKSMLFAKKTGACSVDEIFVPANIPVGVNASTCGHAMHYDCYQQFVEALVVRERARPRQQLLFAQRMLDVDAGEFLCPLCKRLSNTAMPLYPALDFLLMRRPSGPMKTQSFEDWLNDMSEFVNSKGGRPSSAPKPIKGHSRKRSHSERSLVELTKKDPDDQALSTSVPNASAMGELSDLDSSMGAESDAEEPMSPGGTAVPQSPPSLVSAQDIIWGDIPAEARNLLKHMLPHSMMQRFRDLLHRPGGYKENVPSSFVTYDMVRALSKAILSYSFPASSQLSQWSGVTSNSHCASFVLRSIAAVLKAENKPLFGAFNARQRDCFYSMARLVATVSFAAKPNALKHLTMKLLTPLLSRRYGESSSGAAAAASSSASSSSTASKTTPSLLHIDIFSLMVDLCMCIGWVRGGSVDQQQSSPETAVHWLPSGGMDEHFVLKTTLAAQLFQVMATHEDVDDAVTSSTVHPQSPNDDATPTENDRLVSLYDSATGGKVLRRPQKLRATLKSAIVEFCRPTALLYHAITLVPPPEALKDPSIDELEPLCRYLGLPGRLGDLIDTICVEGLWDLWSQRERPHLSTIVRQPVLINSLIRLPEDFSELINRAAHFRCPSMKKEDLVSSVPTLCLVCGELLCSQSYCCQKTVNKESVGACNFHMLSCTGPSGIFLRIRDSQVVLLTSRSRGCLKSAPYVDEFGETDQGFRRGNPLLLNAELYAKLEHLWLHQAIAEEVINQYEINHRNIAFEWQHF